MIKLLSLEVPICLSFSTDMSSTKYQNVQYRVPQCRICSVPSCPNIVVNSQELTVFSHRKKVHTWWSENITASPVERIQVIEIRLPKSFSSIMCLQSILVASSIKGILEIHSRKCLQKSVLNKISWDLAHRVIFCFLPSVKSSCYP